MDILCIEIFKLKNCFQSHQLSISVDMNATIQRL